MNGVIQNYNPLKGFRFILVEFNKRACQQPQAIKVTPAVDGGAQ